MRKTCSKVCKLCPCLVTESTNWARMRTIVTAALQWQYSQTELIFWITLITHSRLRIILKIIARFNNLTALLMNILVMYDMMPCRLTQR